MFDNEMLYQKVRGGLPSAISIEPAEKAGVTLNGYTRGRQFTIYTNSQRIPESNKENISSRR